MPDPDSAPRILRGPERPPAELQRELVADVARAQGYVHHTRDLAGRADAGDLVVAELRELETQLEALHLVTLVAGGWCPRCGTELTDPSRSPSQACHCRRCRVGWTLATEGGRRRAIARPWPDTEAQR